MKLEDENLHIWSTSSYMGDQMFYLAGALHLMKEQQKKGIVIHTGKQSWSPLVRKWHPAESQILKLWSALDFVKGVIFDLEQVRPIDTGCHESLYDVKIATQLIDYNDHTYKISDHLMDFLLPQCPITQSKNRKVAVFQPLSLTNRSEELKPEYTPHWEKSLEQLLEKGYDVYMIGGRNDQKDIEKNYPHFSRLPLINLINKISLLEAFMIIMRKASFVLSCDSWSAWAAIANRVKCGVAAGPTFENGDDSSHLKMLGNADCYCLNWSKEGKNCDNNLSQWIKQNV